MKQNAGTGGKSTHFGFADVAEAEKATLVKGVFDSVASRYNLMNDLMSGGLHRLWKHFAVSQSGVREGGRVLDLAGGTGDLSCALAKLTGARGQIWLTDINNSMLTIGRDRLIDKGIRAGAAQCDAEKIPFPSDYFDCVTVAFGLRNMTHKDVALKEMLRVLKPGGRALVLEFSRVWKPMQPLYDLYSFQILPRMGKFVANDAESYRYLAESIRMHPDQETLQRMMYDAGFDLVDHFNLTGGVVALHRGFKY